MPRKRDDEFWNPGKELITCSRMPLTGGMITAENTEDIWKECGVDIRVSS